MYEFKRLDLVEERIDKVEDRSGKLCRIVYGGSGRKGERENELKLKEGHLERVPKIDSRVNGTKVVIEEMKKYLKSKKVIYREG